MRKWVGTVTTAAAFVCLGAGTANADVLLDQTGSPNPNESILSNQIIPSGIQNCTDDPPSTQVADDFFVPSGDSWNIDSVNVRGSFLGTPPPSNLFVRIYADGGGKPGVTLYQNEGPLPASGGPDYTIALPSVPTLGPGVYWISVQQAGAIHCWTDFPAGENSKRWQWSLRTTSSGSPALMQGGSCEDWSPLNCDPTLLSGSRASTGIDTRYGLAGNRTVTPLSCGAAPVGSGAGNFHPKVSKPQTVLGVRAILKVSEPSDLTIDAKAKIKGKKVDLGTHSLANVTKKAKVRIPLPAPLRNNLSKGVPVKLFLDVTTKPKSGGCGVTKKKLKLKSKVINVRANLVK